MLVGSTAVLVTLVLAIFQLLPRQEKAALGASEETPAQSSPIELSPTPEMIEIELAEEMERVVVTPPIATVNSYDWSAETLKVFARGMYGLNSWDEKFGYVLTAVNRYLSGKLKEDGTPMFGDGTLEGIASQQREYNFYDKHAPITGENLDLADFMLNACFTYRLDGTYTGFPFPIGALYFGWTEDKRPAVYSEVRGTPFVLSYDWKGVIG